ADFGEITFPLRFSFASLRPTHLQYQSTFQLHWSGDSPSAWHCASKVPPWCSDSPPTKVRSGNETELGGSLRGEGVWTNHPRQPVPVHHWPGSTMPFAPCKCHH